ncbi:MAG: hypothetical protein IKF82_01175 [Bacilli bacterium]|nr:hypothetical protein [Bacilli bacterium]
MNNSLIFMTTTTNSSVLENGVIPLTTVQRKRCRSIQNGTNSIILNSPGYYKVNASITFTAPAAGDISIVLQKNNIDVPGITASTTITTATTEVRTLNISGIVRVFCNEGIATLTLVNSGLAATIQNVAFDVEYLD